MIRLTYLLRRKPEMPIEQFQQYWREVHAPLVASHATDLNILRYIQVHTLSDFEHERLPGARGKMEPAYDGVAQLWWESMEALAAAAGTEAGRAADAALIEDERRFIDLPQSPLWLAYEYPQVNPTPENIVATPYNNIVKFYFPLRVRNDRTEEDVQLYWRTSHGPLIRRQAAASGILRYVQVHRFESETEAALRAARGTAVEPYTGHAELWFDRGRLGNATPEGQAAGRRAIEDEAKLIDFERSSMWLAKENVVVDRF